MENGQAISHFLGSPHIEIQDLSLSQFVLQRSAQYRNKPALIDGVTGRSLTYGQLTEMVRALSGGLHERGFGGGVCGLYSPNVPEYAVLLLAIGLAGGVATTFSPLSTVAELTHQLRDSGAQLVFAAPELLP
jgi:acyl-CoA synthetase (AMP-forming)/AMP-acid ligase II